MNKRPASPDFWMPRKMMKSKACKSLTGAAHYVLMIFFTKRQMQKQGARTGKQSWVTVNNGEIVFTYAEARDEYGINTGRFRDAIDQLIDRGFLSIAETGAGMRRVATLYQLDERWPYYGTRGFVEVHRPKRTSHPGFQPGNRHGQKRHNAGRDDSLHREGTSRPLPPTATTGTRTPPLREETEGEGRPETARGLETGEVFRTLLKSPVGPGGLAGDTTVENVGCAPQQLLKALDASAGNGS